jgi:hypothetical protein
MNIKTSEVWKIAPLSVLSQLKSSFCLDQTLLHVLGSEIYVMCSGLRKLGVHCTGSVRVTHLWILALDALY